MKKKITNQSGRRCSSCIRNSIFESNDKSSCASKNGHVDNSTGFFRNSPQAYPIKVSEHNESKNPPLRVRPSAQNLKIHDTAHVLLVAYGFAFDFRCFVQRVIELASQYETIRFENWDACRPIGYKTHIYYHIICIQFIYRYVCTRCVLHYIVYFTANNKLYCARLYV